MDPVYELVKELYKGDHQGKIRKLETWIKASGPYQDYLRLSQLFRLSDLQRDECDAGVIASRKEVDAAWQKLVDMKDRQLKEAREEDIRSTNEWRGLT
jgi:hypothetical protein